MLVCPLRFTVSSPSSGVKRSTRAGWRCSPRHAPQPRGQLGSRATHRVIPRTLQDRSAFPGDGVLPDLADLYRFAIRRAIRFGVPHATNSRKRLSTIQQKGTGAYQALLANCLHVIGRGVLTHYLPVLLTCPVDWRLPVHTVALRTRATLEYLLCLTTSSACQGRRRSVRRTRIIITHYGGPDALQVVEEACPEPKPGEVRVRVLGRRCRLARRAGAGGPSSRNTLGALHPGLGSGRGGGSTRRRCL